MQPKHLQQLSDHFNALIEEVSSMLVAASLNHSNPEKSLQQWMCESFWDDDCEKCKADMHRFESTVENYVDSFGIIFPGVNLYEECINAAIARAKEKLVQQKVFSELKELMLNKEGFQGDDHRGEAAYKAAEYLCEVWCQSLIESTINDTSVKLDFAHEVELVGAILKAWGRKIDSIVYEPRTGFDFKSFLNQ